MDSTEREIRRQILILEEQLSSWEHWHCRRWDCYHHMCKVRQDKMIEIKLNLRVEYTKFKFIRDSKLSMNRLRV